MQHRPKAVLQAEAASCLAALIMLMAALPFTFVSFELQGARQEMDLLDASMDLFAVGYPVLGAIIALAITVIPALYLLTVAYLHVGLLGARALPWARPLVRLLRQLEPWMMADVFLVAALVSMVKIAGDADVSFGPSFWAFGAFVLLMIYTIAEVNYDALWMRIEGDPLPPPQARPGENASAQGLQPCHCCGQLLEGDVALPGRCPRCDARLAGAPRDALQQTWALLLTALILYIPANLYPIMVTTTLGDTVASTIVSGIMLLWVKGSWPIALVIFIASVLVPVIKMLILFWLCLVSSRPDLAGPSLQHRLFQITEFIGRWSMVDVFVVGILVALIQRGAFMTVLPGPAALAFCAVVIFTMLAARAFDSRLIWMRATAGPDQEAH